MKLRSLLGVGLVALLLVGVVPPAAEAATKSAIVSGAFVDALTGAPLAHTKVKLYVGIEGGGLHADTTDAAGRFRFVVTEAQHFETFGVDIQVEDGDKTFQQVTARILNGANVNLGTLRWQKNGSVTVRVGKRGAKVGEAYFGSLINAQGVEVASCYILNGKSCHMSYAEPGRYAVRLELESAWAYAGNTALFEKARRVSISSGTAQTYVIDAKRSTGSIGGVLDPKGTPETSTASLSAHRLKGSERDGVGILDRGSFVVTGLPPGEYSLSASLDYTTGVHLTAGSTFSSTGKEKHVRVSTGEKTSVGRLHLAAKYFQLGWA